MDSGTSPWDQTSALPLSSSETVASVLLSLCLSFLIDKMEEIIAATSPSCRETQIYTNVFAQSKCWVSICFYAFVEPGKSYLVPAVGRPIIAPFPADPK